MPSSQNFLPIFYVFFLIFCSFLPQFDFQKKLLFFCGFIKARLNFFHKNKLGLSLGPKLGKKFENKVQKLSNLKKKDFSGQKKQAGAELGQTVGEPNWEKRPKIDQFKKKKRKKTFQAKKTSWGWASEEKKGFFGSKIGKKFQN